MRLPETSLRILLYTVANRAAAGGAEGVVRGLADGLRGHGHRVTESWGDSRPFPADGDGAQWPCPLHLRPGPRPWHLPSVGLAAWGLARVRPQVVNVHIITGQARYFLLLGRAMGARVVVSAHGSDLLHPADDCARHLPAILRAADAVTVVSEPLRDRAAALGGLDPAQVTVIPNGIDTDFWTPAAPTERAPLVVALGRLERVKGFDVLLTAFAMLRERMPGVRLCLIGDGSQASVLRAQAVALGVADAVDFPGLLGPQAVRDRLRAATVFALSSRSEGMPLALLEAMACGLPVVATAVGAVPQVVGGKGAGLVVPPENPAALAAALAAVLADGPRRARLADGALAVAVTHSAAAAHAAYERLYRTLLS